MTKLFIMIVSCFTFAQLVLAQAPAAPKATLSFSSNALATGTTAKGICTVTFAPGFHGYQNPPNKEFLTPVAISCLTKGVKFKPTYPKGALLTSAGEETPTAVYSGKTEIPFTLVLPKKAGKQKLQFEVVYQQCDEHNCWPPSTIKIDVTIVVTKSR